MEYNHAFLYGVPQGQERPKTRDRRPSLRMRTSFFGGGKRRSWDSDESFDNSSPTRTPIEELEPENISHNRRRGLKKMSSKSSLSSVASFSTNSEGSTEKKSKARLWQEAIFRSKPSNQQPRSTPPIVQVSPGMYPTVSKLLKEIQLTFRSSKTKRYQRTFQLYPPTHHPSGRCLEITNRRNSPGSRSGMEQSSSPRISIPP